MKHYKLTAEQMQQVREAVEDGLTTLACVSAIPMRPEARSIVDKSFQRSRYVLALLDAAMQAPEATDPLDRPMGGHLLDSVRYPVLPEATAGGDVREDVLVEGALMMIHHRDRVAGWGDITPRERLRMYGEARGAVRAALAAAPKPCEHGCVGGVITAYTLNRGTQKIDCPIHGTKPEAPTELCKVCGYAQELCAGIQKNGLWSTHPFTPTDAKCRHGKASHTGGGFCIECGVQCHHPTDATPKDEEPGR